MKNNDKKEKILKYIINCYEQDGIIPTIREIAKAVNLKSTSSIQRYLVLLEEEGLINRSTNKKRSTVPKNIQKIINVPIIGKVTAGVPITAIENFDGYVQVSAEKVKSDECFALTIKGDSMINVGINDGDIIVVKKTSFAENGNIVVAMMDDEATVKKFYKEKGRFRLQPENDNYSPIIVDSLTILGVVISLVRHY